MCLLLGRLENGLLNGIESDVSERPRLGTKLFRLAVGCHADTVGCEVDVDDDALIGIAEPLCGVSGDGHFGRWVPCH